MAAFLVSIVLWTRSKIAGALLVLALLDYRYQRCKFEQDLRMTPQEVREEMRNLQGDPQVIARRRAVQRQLVLNRLSQTVPKADVIVTNPTELAVAIQYDASTMNAPVVVAKGAGLLAQRIRRLALENGVPIVERKPLAQALYRDVDINQPVPDTMYAAVAEVLAYVYHLKGKSICASRLARASPAAKLVCATRPKPTWTLGGLSITFRPSSHRPFLAVSAHRFGSSSLDIPEFRMAAGAAPRAGAIASLGRWQDLILPVGIIASVLVILVPMPTPLMDLLLAANITLAVIMLLTTIYVRTPLEFSIFPVVAAGHDARRGWCSTWPRRG